MQPTPGDVHVNTPLTNISIHYAQSASNFIADQVFSNIPVAKQSDVYYEYDRGFFNRDEMEVRAPATESKGSGYAVSTTPYYAPVYAFHHDIPDERRANADSVLNQDREATELVTMKALIKREKTWLAANFGLSIWTTERVGDPAPTGTQFLHWDNAASTPIEDVRAATTDMHELTGFRPNTMTIDPRTFDALLDHPDIIDRVKYGQTAAGRRSIAMIDTTDLQQLFKMDRVLVAGAIENTAAEGQTNVHSFMAGDNCLLTYRPPSPGLMTPSAGYTFSWNGFLGSADNGMRIKRFRMELIASDRIEIEMAFVQQIVSPDLGFFFSNTIT